MSGWKTWQEFRSAQQEIVLPAGTAAHIPVTIRYVDVGEAQRGTILLMHGIPTWGYLYHAIIPPLVHSGYRVLTPDFLGHGWSDRRDQFDQSFQDQARMISTLLQALQLERDVAVVSESFSTEVVSSRNFPKGHVWKVHDAMCSSYRRC